EPQVTQTIDPGVPATATPVPYTPTSTATLTPTDIPPPIATSTPAGCPNFAAGGNITMTASCTMDTAATIASNTTIEGGGFTLTASGLGTSEAGRHFLVNASVTLTINNLTLTGGVDPYSGGSIYNNGTLIMSGSTVTGNSTNNNSVDPLVGGGALNNSSTGTMTITNSNINNNSTPDRGGGILNGNTGNTLTITDTTFTGNSPNHVFGSYTDGEGNTFINP
ncbi:MAG: hypothetical protein ACOYLB_16745, partial [Phototrophicaceae bacterium]